MSHPIVAVMTLAKPINKRVIDQLKGAFWSDRITERGYLIRRCNPKPDANHCLSRRIPMKPHAF